MSQLDRQRARKDALVKRHLLEDAIQASHATAEEKAFMAQHLAHLVKSFDAACGGEECRP